MIETLLNDISPVSMVCGGIAILIFIITVFYGFSPIRRILSYFRDNKDNLIPADIESHIAEQDVTEETPAEDFPAKKKVSVIVYTENTDYPLEDYINILLEQDYPNFEIIGVNDASHEATAIVAEKFEGNNRVYITFVPQGSHNVSRRKLALTIGMKAAHGEIVLTTVSNAEIPSNSWLSQMAAPFNENPSTQVVLGVSTMNFHEMDGINKWYRQFDYSMSTFQWLGYAIDGSAYRGDGYNLAFLRKIFFEHKGYAKTINLHSGDDDLFVHEITRPGNTSVVLSPQSLLTTNWGESTKRVYTHAKEKYDFDARWLPGEPFMRAGILSLCQWVMLASCIAGALFSMTNIFAISIATVLLLSYWATDISLYRRAAPHIASSRLWWIAIPIFMLAHPIVNFFFKLKHKSSRIKNFTWVRKRSK